MKRILTMILAVVLLAGLPVLHAQSAETAAEATVGSFAFDR